MSAPAVGRPGVYEVVFALNAKPGCPPGKASIGLAAGSSAEARTKALQRAAERGWDVAKITRVTRSGP